MSAGIFALIGTLLGISGTLLAEMRRERTETNRSRRETLRTTCAEFTDAIIRVRELSPSMGRHPSDADLREAVHRAHHESWSYYERLRLLSTSRDVQEASKLLRRVRRWMDHLLECDVLIGQKLRYAHGDKVPVVCEWT